MNHSAQQEYCISEYRGSTLWRLWKHKVVTWREVTGWGFKARKHNWICGFKAFQIYLMLMENTSAHMVFNSFKSCWIHFLGKNSWVLSVWCRVADNQPAAKDKKMQWLNCWKPNKQFFSWNLNLCFFFTVCLFIHLFDRDNAQLISRTRVI